MHFSVPQLFAQFFSSPAPVSLDHLQQTLQLTDPQQLAELEIALNALIRLGFIEQLGTDPEYRRLSDESLVVGRLRCSSKGFCFAIRDEPGVEDIYIHGTNLNGAWNGDQVLARITKDGNRRKSPEGEVAAVIERANPTIVGKLQRIEEGFKAVPLDDRLLFELKVIPPAESDPVAEWPEGSYAYIEVQNYSLANLPPLGEVRKVLGSSPESTMDIDLVCCKYNLSQSFAPELIAAVESLPQKISKTDLKKRQDYREWQTLTIEPAELQHPRGLEPSVGISLHSDPSGSWQLAVHIADLAHWLETSHPAEQEAAQRTAAVTLDSMVLPLYPLAIYSRYGLAPQQERFTITVLLNLGLDGVVQSYEIHPSVVKSQVHLTYEQIQTLLTPPLETDEAEAPSELLLLLQQLYQVSQSLRNQRHQAHGFELPMLDLLTPHSADENQSGSLVLSRQLLAHAMMSELTLAANVAIGKHLQTLKLPAVYRIQPAPPVEAIQSFLRLTTNMKLDLKLADPEQVQIQDYQQFANRIQAADLMELGATPALTAQLLNPLPPATYVILPADPSIEAPLSPDSAEESNPVMPLGYFGLGQTDPYCHAASPLRRYADLLNQRALHLLFEQGRDKRTQRSKKVDLHSSTAVAQVDWEVLPAEAHQLWISYLRQQVEVLNQRQQQVHQAELELKGLKKSEFMQAHLGEVFAGLIIGVQNYGFFVQVDPMLAEGLVHVSSLKNDWYEYRSRQQALVGRKSRKQFRLGDRVEVQIKNVDYYRQQVDLLVVGEGRLYEDDDL